MEMFGPGDVPVVDVMGRIREGTFGGDNLIFSMFVATGNGFVVDGSFRDLDGVYPMMTPVFSRGYHPGVRGNAILTGLNTPIRIGAATVMPGDVVLGDRMGIVFIPPHLVQKVVEHADGAPAVRPAGFLVVEASLSPDSSLSAVPKTLLESSRFLPHCPLRLLPRKTAREWHNRRQINTLRHSHQQTPHAFNPTH